MLFELRVRTVLEPAIVPNVVAEIHQPRNHSHLFQEHETGDEKVDEHGVRRVSQLTEHLIREFTGHAGRLELFQVANHGEDLIEMPDTEDFAECYDRSFIYDDMRETFGPKRFARSLECCPNEDVGLFDDVGFEGGARSSRYLD